MITEEFTPKNRKDWREWLALNHDTANGIWVIFYKKSSENYNLSYAEARDEALCFGWIDSTKDKLDENRFKQYFSPRRKNSVWSVFNRKKINELITEGLMTDAGFKVIEEAKQNGNYYILKSEIPEELKIEFKNNKKAEDIFNGLSKSDKKHIINQIYSLKTDVGRKNKSKKMIELLVFRSLRGVQSTTRQSPVQ